MKEQLVQSENELELGDLYKKAKQLIDNARDSIGLMANAVTVYTSFELGRYIIEQEQQGQDRAKYGAKVLDSLSAYLTEEYGKGFSRSNVAGMRQFYITYRDHETAIVQSGVGQLQINYDEWPFRLSWTHYQVLMRISDPQEREFYEKEAIRSNWNVKTLKRQYSSSLYERLALSRDKEDVLRLSSEGATPQKPSDILHTPYILEFSGLDDKASYHESDLEQSVIDKMQNFLLEMGKGFLFEQRQKRFTFHDKNFYLDLVLYNRFLRCYVLIDFKIDELTHQDLGQMQMYVNYYDRYEITENENPTIGILICKQSDEACIRRYLDADDKPEGEPENHNLALAGAKLENNGNAQFWHPLVPKEEFPLESFLLSAFSSQSDSF